MSFPRTFCDYSLSSPLKPLSNSLSHSQKPSFLFHSTSNLQGKGMGFLSLTTYFMFWALFSWFCELGLKFVISVVSDMGLVHVCYVWVFGFGWSCFLNAKYGCYHVLVSLFEFVNWSVLVGYSHTHDNMSHWHMLQYSWLVHVKVCAWECALEVFMIELLYSLSQCVMHKFCW